MPIVRMQLSVDNPGDEIGATATVTSKAPGEPTRHWKLEGVGTESSQLLYLEDGDKVVLDVTLKRKHGYDADQFAATLEEVVVEQPIAKPAPKTALQPVEKKIHEE